MQSGEPQSEPMPSCERLLPEWVDCRSHFVEALEREGETQVLLGPFPPYELTWHHRFLQGLSSSQREAFGLLFALQCARELEFQREADEYSWFMDDEGKTRPIPDWMHAAKFLHEKLGAPQIIELLQYREAEYQYALADEYPDSLGADEECPDVEDAEDSEVDREVDLGYLDDCDSQDISPAALAHIRKNPTFEGDYDQMVSDAEAAAWEWDIQEDDAALDCRESDLRRMHDAEPRYDRTGYYEYEP